MWFEKHKFRPPPKPLPIKWHRKEFQRKAATDAMALKDFIRLNGITKSAENTPVNVGLFVGKL
jgi:hypothetical protein